MCQSVSKIKNAFLLLLGVNCDNAGWIFRAKIWTFRKIVVTLHPLWERRRDVAPARHQEKPRRDVAPARPPPKKKPSGFPVRHNDLKVET